MVKSSNEGSWLRSKMRSRIEFSADRFTFLKGNGKMLMYSSDQSVSP